MKRNLLLFAIVIIGLMSCTSKKDLKTHRFYLGTYTEGESQGIYQGILKSDGSFDSLSLAVESVNPSFLCFANGDKTLLAVNEIDVDSTGTIEAYSITPKGLVRVSASTSGGAHPCHVASNKRGDVLMANYSGGNIGYVKVDRMGNLSEIKSVAQHVGTGATERQTKSHAHSVWFTDDEHAVAVDLGIDQLIFYELKDDTINKVDSLKLESGSGPRHLAMHPDKKLMYLINELNNTIIVLGKTTYRWEMLSSISTLPKDFTGESYCADIHISADGHFVYASNRGHNSIAIFKVVDKKLELLGHESVRGDWPRNFALTPDDEFLVVANQRSDNLVAFKRDKQTGLLTYLGEQGAETPVCVLFK